MLMRPSSMFGEHGPWRVSVSLLIVAAGIGLRTWAGGSAGNHTRTVEIEAPQLTTGGPYAYVRNPIYLGTVIIGIGMVGILGDARLLVLHAVVSTLLFALVVPCEEQFLRTKYGGEYEAYFRAVPRLIPKFRPWRGKIERPFFRGVLRGEGGIILILVCVYLVMRIARHLH